MRNLRKVWEALAALAMAVLLLGCLAAGAELSDSAPGVAEPLSSGGAVLPDAPAVRSDWSKLTPYVPAEALYTTFDPYSGSGPLLPRDDYGILIPYVGAELDPASGERLPLYGLATLDGRVVTDPVYTDVSRLGPFLLLTRGASLSYERDEAWEFTYLNEVREVTIAAADGRWTLDAGDWDHYFLLDDRMVAARTDGSVLVLSADGETAAEFPRTALEPYLGRNFQWGGRAVGYEEGGELVCAGAPWLAVCYYDEDSPYGNYWRYDCFLNMDTGAVSGTAPAGWTPENGWGGWDEAPDLPGYVYPDRVEDLATGAVYYCGPRTGASASDLLDADGKLVLADCFIGSALQWEPFLAGGMIGVVSDGTFTYTRIDGGEVVFRYPLRTNSD